MRRVLGVMALTLALTACEPLAENDGSGKSDGIMYKSPPRTSGVIVGESARHITITVRHGDGAVRTYHVSPKQVQFCSVGELWPSCTAQQKPRRDRGGQPNDGRKPNA